MLIIALRFMRTHRSKSPKQSDTSLVIYIPFYYDILRYAKGYLTCVRPKQSDTGACYAPTTPQPHKSESINSNIMVG